MNRINLLILQDGNSIYSRQLSATSIASEAAMASKAAELANAAIYARQQQQQQVRKGIKVPLII